MGVQATSTQHPFPLKFTESTGHFSVFSCSNPCEGCTWFPLVALLTCHRAWRREEEDLGDVQSSSQKARIVPSLPSSQAPHFQENQWVRDEAVPPGLRCSRYFRISASKNPAPALSCPHGSYGTKNPSQKSRPKEPICHLKYMTNSYSLATVLLLILKPALFYSHSMVIHRLQEKSAYLL